MILGSKYKNLPLGIILSVAVFLSILIGPISPDKAEAATGTNFQPGNIISDSVFFNGASLSAGDIQSFLNSKLPNCLLGVNGRKVPGTPDPAYSSGRVIYANSCLRDYRESIPSLSGDQFCASISGGNFSSAELIQKVGSACNVSPKVLIVLLEKEQSLVTDAFPSTIQYGSATGFNCPDTAPCSAASSGFFKQLYSAARQFQAYGTGIFTWYPVGSTTAVLYHPNSQACGTGPVLIENRATAALYYYTPYQPNSAAMNNLYGFGDQCSSYGNRNFWRMFTDWFGTTHLVEGAKEFVTAAYNDVLGRAPESTAVLNTWATALSNGMSRGDMANAFNNSDEYRAKKVEEAYLGVLGRMPEPAGLEHWMRLLRNGVLSPEDVYATFLHTDEFYFRLGGGTNTGYVTALYQNLLSRSPDAPGLSGWLSLLDSGQPRSNVSRGFWYSDERYAKRVEEAFQLFLGRGSSDGDRIYWSGISRNNGPTAMRSGIMSSQEYWNRASQRY